MRVFAVRIDGWGEEYLRAETPKAALKASEAPDYWKSALVDVDPCETNPLSSRIIECTAEGEIVAGRITEMPRLQRKSNTQLQAMNT